jgi:hypothetical protein
MDDLSERLEKLGGAVSETAERLIDPGELSAARRMWLQRPSRAPSGRSRVLRAGVLVAACLVALVCFFAVRRPARLFTMGGDSPSPPAEPVSFQVGAPPSTGTVGEWVAAGRGARLPVRFSEGTSFVLGPGATARVTEATAHGATLLLEQGNVAADVVHSGAETRWSLHAGPFEVLVTGTKFDAIWDPAGETFDLAMHEGAVLVKGPLLQAGRELRAGERLRVSVRDGAMELRRVVTMEPASTMGPQAAPDPGPAEPAPITVEPAQPALSAAATPSSAGAAAPSWRELSAAGKYNEALAAAERAGFTQEVERASSRDLATLADAARYASRPALAVQALLAQRRRFGARGSSAFVLGKIAADQQGAPAEAVRWFETYLQEEPNGALAEQALGRLLLLRKGDKATAERYLARHPNGVQAPLARAILRAGPSSP